MVKILKFLAYVTFFLLALIYFIPKSSVYYYVEQELALKKVIVSQEKIVENSFSLDIKDATLFYDEIQSAKIQNVNTKLFLVYNSVEAQNIVLSDMVSSFIPVNIDTLTIKHTFFNPLKLELNAKGKFGEMSGEVNILDKNISIILIPSKIMLLKHKNSLAKFKKNEKGEYQYDKTF